MPPVADLDTFMPTCARASMVELMAWACPRHDPVLRADCQSCSERTGTERAMIVDQLKRLVMPHTQEETAMPKAGTGWWDQVDEATGRVRIEVAKERHADGESGNRIETEMGGPLNSLLPRLKRDGIITAKPQAPKPAAAPRPLQVTPPPVPADPTLRDPLETRIPVQDKPLLTVDSKTTALPVAAPPLSTWQEDGTGAIDDADAQTLAAFIRFAGLTGEAEMFLAGAAFGRRAG